MKYEKRNNKRDVIAQLQTRFRVGQRATVAYNPRDSSAVRDFLGRIITVDRIIASHDGTRLYTSETYYFDEELELVE